MLGRAWYWLNGYLFSGVRKSIPSVIHGLQVCIVQGDLHRMPGWIISPFRL
jgi:hypothetical protein